MNQRIGEYRINRPKFHHEADSSDRASGNNNNMIREGLKQGKLRGGIPSKRTHGIYSGFGQDLVGAKVSQKRHFLNRILEYSRIIRTFGRRQIVSDVPGGVGPVPGLRSFSDVGGGVIPDMLDRETPLTNRIKNTD